MKSINLIQIDRKSQSRAIELMARYKRYKWISLQYYNIKKKKKKNERDIHYSLMEPL